MPFENSKTESNPALQNGEASRTRFKPSRFNAHTVAPDGTLILLNTYTGHSCGISGSGAELAAPYLSRRGFVGALDRMGKYLLSKGYIIPEHVDEYGRWEVQFGYLHYRPDLLRLILLPTEQCNFRCIYCPERFLRGSMTSDVRRGILNLVQRRIKRLNRLQISWFGGEPLLAYDIIAELAPSLQNVAAMNDVEYGSDITTNGYLLSPERFRQMVQWGITNYLITVDGPKDVHDMRRRLQDGGSTFDRIIENIAATGRLDQQFQVRVRVNFDHHNIDHVGELFQELHALIGSDPRYVLTLSGVGKMGGPNDDHLDVCEDDFLQCAKRIRCEARWAGLNCQSALNSISGRQTCHATQPFSFVIGADGSVMKCSAILDKDHMNVVGKISEDGNINLNEDAVIPWIRPYFQSDSLCSKCFLVPVCQGGRCPLPRVRRGGRPCLAQPVPVRALLLEAWEARLNCNESRRPPGVVDPEKNDCSHPRLVFEGERKTRAVRERDGAGCTESL